MAVGCVLSKTYFTREWETERAGTIILATCTSDMAGGSLGISPHLTSNSWGGRVAITSLVPEEAS